MSNPLKAFNWDFIISTNKDLCQKSGHQHGTTSDGYTPARKIFEDASLRPEMNMPEVAETLRKLHKVAPFLFLNGNTFSEVGKTMLALLSDSPSAKIRSLIGHHIAGTEILTKEELAAAFDAENDAQSGNHP